MNITVYLGASVGNDPAFLPAVQELGNWIGSNGHALVYGGSKSGLMGALADSVLEAGGHVTGVEPSFFIEAEFQHDGIDDLIVTSDMAERKAKMIELGDAFIAFPGGTGTLEEIAEVMSAVSLGHLSAPCILYNLDGYYNDLKALLEHMIDKGLSSPTAPARHLLCRGSARNRINYQRISLEPVPPCFPLAPFAAQTVGLTGQRSLYNKTYLCRI